MTCLQQRTQIGTLLLIAFKKKMDEQNLMLVAEVSDVEVKNTVFYMYPNKSPGPDGMSP